MKELWIKKTVYRRYLVNEEDLDAVTSILEEEPRKASEFIEDIYDNNENVEYDNEEIVFPIIYNISDT